MKKAPQSPPIINFAEKYSSLPTKKRSMVRISRRDGAVLWTTEALPARATGSDVYVKPGEQFEFEVNGPGLKKPLTVVFGKGRPTPPGVEADRFPPYPLKGCGSRVTVTGRETFTIALNGLHRGEYVAYKYSIKDASGHTIVDPDIVVGPPDVEPVGG